jgi:hypothetical protein
MACTPSLQIRRTQRNFSFAFGRLIALSACSNWLRMSSSACSALSLGARKLTSWIASVNFFAFYQGIRRWT